tara:strand:+ start:136 stop:759 length:624 start_codon:yes stop_codon:yes gene_type:complete
MKVDDLLKKYKLKKEKDCWHHKQSGKWILTHASVEKICVQENIELVEIRSLTSVEQSVRFLVTMKKDDRIISTVGEADKTNCTSKYYGCMAEKRGYDRCVLKLIDAYAHGFVSEEESDDWKQPESESASMATAYQGAKLVEVLKHFDSYDKEKAKYVYKHLTKKEADLMIQLMESGKVEKFQDLFYEAYDLLLKTENLWKSIKGEVE